MKNIFRNKSNSPELSTGYLLDLKADWVIWVVMIPV